MPGSAGVVHEAGVPLRPSISTRQRRHDPKASRLSVAQSFGIGLSTSAAAAMTEVPGGTLTWRPSIVRVTLGAPVRIGVPTSSSCKSAIGELLFRRRAQRLGEIFAEVVESAEDRQWREPAERAERPVRQDFAEVAQKLDVLLAVAAGQYLVDRLSAAGRSNAARGALAAAFLGAEFEGEARLAREIDGVVEDGDPPMPQHAPDGEHRLVVQGSVEQLFRKIGAERAADLNSPDRPPRPRPAAEALHQLADCRAEREFDEATVAHVASELERLGAKRAADAILGVS